MATEKPTPLQALATVAKNVGTNLEGHPNQMPVITGLLYMGTELLATTRIGLRLDGDGSWRIHAAAQLQSMELSDRHFLIAGCDLQDAAILMQRGLLAVEHLWWTDNEVKAAIGEWNAGIQKRLVGTMPVHWPAFTTTLPDT